MPFIAEKELVQLNDYKNILKENKHMLKRLDDYKKLVNEKNETICALVNKIEKLESTLPKTEAKIALQKTKQNSLKQDYRLCAELSSRNFVRNFVPEAKLGALLGALLPKQRSKQEAKLGAKLGAKLQAKLPGASSAKNGHRPKEVI